MISKLLAWFTGTGLGKLVTAAVVALGVLLGAVRYGRQQEADDASHEALRAYKETKEKIDEAQSSPDRDAAVDRMRRNGWLER